MRATGGKRAEAPFAARCDASGRGTAGGLPVRQAGAECEELLQGLGAPTCVGIDAGVAVAVRVYAGLSRSG